MGRVPPVLTAGGAGRRACSGARRAAVAQARIDKLEAENGSKGKAGAARRLARKHARLGRLTADARAEGAAWASRGSEGVWAWLTRAL